MSSNVCNEGRHRESKDKRVLGKGRGRVGCSHFNGGEVERRRTIWPRYLGRDARTEGIIVVFISIGRRV